MKSLRLRIFASIGFVSLLALVIGALVTQALAPENFAQRLGQGFGRRFDPQTSDIEVVFTEALQQGLMVGVIVALLAGLVGAGLIARYLARSISPVRDATRRLAAGDYSIRVPDQSVSELVEIGRDINTLAVELDETERRRTRLIGNVAHELRTPLTTIEGYMEGLSDGVFEPSAEIYATVGGEAARLRRLSNDLAALSKAEEAHPPPNPEPIALAELLHQVTDRLRPQFVDQEVELLVDVKRAGTVQGSSDQLIQVFTNVLGNALGHTPPGGSVAVRAATDRGSTRVTISDTGEGIPPTQLEHIFERFYRVPRPGGDGSKGSGIGLTIARSIARSHDGNLEAFSEGLGAGSEFVITLPVIA